MAKRKMKYIEPADYFPEEIRKKYKIGEYADDDDPEKATKEEPEKQDKGN
ncbi:MAG: hypothetical protein ACOYJO_07790 [Eubacterium sp.]|jgi:hypothetical protein